MVELISEIRIPRLWRPRLEWVKRNRSPSSQARKHLYTRESLARGPVDPSTRAADSPGMAAAKGDYQVPRLLGLWAILVVVTFSFAGAKIHYALIDALFDSLSLRFSADDRLQMPAEADGMILDAALRDQAPEADKLLRPAAQRQPGFGSECEFRPGGARG